MQFLFSISIYSGFFCDIFFQQSYTDWASYFDKKKITFKSSLLNLKLLNQAKPNLAWVVPFQNCV